MITFFVFSLYDNKINLPTCNGVGGIIKRLAAHADLQHPFSNEILTPKQLSDFAEANVDGITLFFVSSKEVASNTKFLES